MNPYGQPLLHENFVHAFGSRLLTCKKSQAEIHNQKIKNEKKSVTQPLNLGRVSIQINASKRGV